MWWWPLCPCWAKFRPGPGFIRSSIHIVSLPPPPPPPDFSPDFTVVCLDLLWYRPHRWRVQRNGRLFRAEKQVCISSSQMCIYIYRYRYIHDFIVFTRGNVPCSLIHSWLMIYNILVNAPKIEEPVIMMSKCPKNWGTRWKWQNWWFVYIYIYIV